MNKRDSNNRIIILIGILFFSINILLSYKYYLEKMVMVDCAYQLFEIINNSSFSFQVYRYVAIFTKIFPLIGVKLNYSLQSITILYSISFTIFYLFNFLIITLLFRNFKMGSIFILYHSLIMTHTFFWPTVEIIQGVSIFMTFIAYLIYIRSKPIKFIHIFISLIFIFFTVFSHPLLIILVLFVGICSWVNGIYQKNRIFVIFLSIISLTFIKTVFLSNNYDDTAFSKISNFINIFPNYLDLVSNKNFIFSYIKDYYVMIILYFIILYHYCKSRQYLNALIISIFSIGLILFINVIYYQGAEQFYLEGQYALSALALSIALLHILNNKTFINIIIIISTALYFTRISNILPEYSKRLKYYDEIIIENIKNNKPKVVIPIENIDLSTLKMTWGVSYEVWLYSTIKYDYSASIIVEDNPGEYDISLSYRDIFIGKWNTYKYSEMDRRYFKFDNNSIYKKIK